MIKAYWLLFILAMIFHQSCGQNRSSIIDFSNAEIQYPVDLNKEFAKIKHLDNIRSVLVSLNDTLIAEQYFSSFPPDSLEHVRSVTKSVMSTLIGIAIDKGHISSVEEPIAKYFGDAAKGKEHITIKHLLTMTSGIKWREVLGNMEIDQWIHSNSPMQYVLDKPIEYQVGTQWVYSTGIIHLLSVILTKASGMNTLTFAKENLFKPLNIDSVKWQLLNDGYFHGGSRLQIKPKDMIKIGQLFASGGLYNGKRVLSENYIKEATSHHQPKAFFGEDDGYGYAWWVGEGNGLKGFMASGYGGQTILVIPAHQIVIVITYKWKVSGQKASDQQRESMDVVVGSILEALFTK